MFGLLIALLGLGAAKSRPSSAPCAGCGGHQPPKAARPRVPTGTRQHEWEILEPRPRPAPAADSSPPAKDAPGAIARPALRPLANRPRRG